MKRILPLFLCTALILTLFSGCSQEKAPHTPTGDGLTWDDGPVPTPTDDKEEQALTLVYFPDRSLNPLQSSDFTNRTLFSLIYQGLFAVGRDYLPEPILCSRYSMSEDMRTYTFYIEDATFSDGTPVTAEDVTASLLAASESPYYGGRFLHVKDIFTSWDGGVTVTLDTAYENLPILLDTPILKASELEAAAPLGTGPYYYENTPSGMRLRRRGDWWCRSSNMAVTALSIPLVVGESPAQIRDDFEFSDVGLVCTDPGSDAYADYRCDRELWDCENGIFLYLGCNVNSEVFKNPKVRSALTHAIDRELLAEEYYRGFARAATLPASPDSPYYSQTLAEKYGFDSVKFAQAVTQAGMQGKEVALLVNKDDSMRLRVAKAIQKMLEDCGLKVTLRLAKSSDYVYYLNIGNFDLYLGQTKLSPNMDLTPFFYTGGALRQGGMSSASLYALCLDSLANQGNYYNLHQKVMEDGRLCPILFRSYAVYATRGLVSDLSPARDTVFYYSLGKTMEGILVPEAGPEPTQPDPSEPDDSQPEA